MTTPASGITSLLGRFVVLGMAVVPPSVLAFSFWNWVQGNVAGAFLIAAGYELLLFVGGFTGKVFGDLQNRWVKAAADRADELLRRTSAKFERDYRRQVRESVRFVDQKGLLTRGDAPELEQIYVDVSLESRPPRETAGGALLASLPPVSHERRSLSDFLQRDEAAVLALIGAPGTGKTTLLRHTTLRLCSGVWRRRPLPVLLYLRDQAAVIVDRPDIGLPEVIASRLGRLRDQEPAGWFDTRLEKGRCVVMLDGLDEVPHAEHRRRVVDWVERQIAQYPHNDFVLTSRPYGYREYPLDSAAVLLVRRFTAEQITLFVRAWYRAADRLAGEDLKGPDTSPEALLEQLWRNSQLFDLAANPLLLTMIVNVHRIRGELPGTRAELYAEICRVVLWRHDFKRGLEPAENRPGGEGKERILRKLAFTMMADKTRDLPYAKVLALLEASLAAQPADETDARDVLADVENSGLLLEREAGVWSFSHQTFQEYLAAAFILDDPALESVLTAEVDNPWWRETTLLYAARTDPGDIVRACLASGTVPALTLAFDCVDEGRPVAPEIRAELDGLLQHSSRAGQERSRLLSAVTVTRHLRAAFRVQDQVWVCARPVTAEIYRRSGLADRPGALVWSGPGAGAADGPAGPLWPDDVAALISWVNELFPDGPAYRLPTLEVVNDPVFALAVNPAERPVWVGLGEDRSPAVHSPEVTRHPFAAAPSLVSARVQEDLQDDTVRDAALVACLLYRVHLRKWAISGAHALGASFGDLVRLGDFTRDPRRNRERELVQDDLREADPFFDRVEEFVIYRDEQLMFDIGRVRGLVRHLTGDSDISRVRRLDLGGDRRACLVRSASIFLCRWLAASGPKPSDASAGAKPIMEADDGAQPRLSQLLRPHLPQKQSAPLPPDALLAELRAGALGIGELADRQQSADLHMAHDLAKVMCAVAEDVLEGDGRFDAEFVRCIRLGALAVVAAVRTPRPSSTTRKYWAVAAGITAMEQRALNRSHLPDALVLVRS